MQFQLGDAVHHQAPTPQSVAALAPVVAIDAGFQHTCAVLGDGTVRCWGYGSLGQLGTGTAIDGPTPAEVIGLGDVVAVSAGDAHTCALLSTGEVDCWGYNL